MKCFRTPICICIILLPLGAGLLLLKLFVFSGSGTGLTYKEMADMRLHWIERDLDTYYWLNKEYPPEHINSMDASESLSYAVSREFQGPERKEYFFAEEEGKRNGWAVTDSNGHLVFLGVSNQPIRYARKSATSCMIWDVGPNGKDENGGGDDIVIRLEKKQ